MKLSNWIHSLRNRTQKRRHRRDHQDALRRRLLRVESLEDRRLLSVFSSSDVPKSITGGLVTSGLTVPDSVTISDVNVTLNITHTRDADLDVYLRSPNNTRVELFTDVGGTGDNFTDTTLDDEASTAIDSGSAPFSSTYRPEGSLSDFNGGNSSGTWTLEITDDAAGDIGTLNSWSIDISSAGPANQPPTVTLANTITTLPENTDTTNRIKVADIVVSDDDEGSETLTLAALPEVWSSEALFVGSGSITSVLAIEDTNGDGNRELAVLQDGLLHFLELDASSTGSISYTLRDSFSVPTDLPGIIDIQDMDADGNVDVALRSFWNSPAHQVKLLELSGGAFVERATISASPTLRGTAVADLDGDGLFEVVTSAWSTVTIHEATGSNTYQQTYQTSLSGLATEDNFRVGDYDNDGNLEFLVTMETTPSKIYAIEATGNNAYSASVVATGVGGNVMNLAGARDLDGDGNSELVFTDDDGYSEPNRRTYVHESGSQVTSMAGVDGRGLGDTDGDGLGEIIGLSSGRLVVLESDGSSGFVTELDQDWNIFQPGYRPAVQDVDDDGIDEFFGRVQAADATYSTLQILTRTDQSIFEIDGSELFLKAGTTLDFATNPQLHMTVEVDDPTVGNTPDDTASLAISITEVAAFDFGDAPTAAQGGFAGSYPTTLANNGARHTATGPTLGTVRDSESDGQPTATADGDDTNGAADEDGVVFTSPLIGGQTAGVDVTVSAAGLLSAWIDFNSDGDWGDAGEQIFTDAAVAAGVNSLSFAVPNTPTDTTYARFRLSTAGGLSFDGTAADGEVEDYAFGKIVGSKFFDRDADGTWDTGEQGLAGWLVYVDMNENGQRDADEPYGVTDSSGAYCIAGLPPGTYTIAEQDMPGWEQTFPDTSGPGLTFVEAQFDGQDDGHGNTVDGIQFTHDVTVSPDGLNVYAAGGSDSALAVFSRDNATGALTYIEMLKDGQTDGQGNLIDGLGYVTCVTVSPDGKHVYAGGHTDDEIVVFQRDAATGRLTFEQVYHGAIDGVYSIDVSPDGNNVYLGAWMADALFTFNRDSTTGRLSLAQTLYDGTGGVDGLDVPHSVTVSPDNKHVYTAGLLDNDVAVFSRNLSTGTLTFVQTYGLYRAVSVEVSPDGHYVYAASREDSTLNVYSRNMITGQLTLQQSLVDGQDDGQGKIVDGLNHISAMTISADGSYLYSAGLFDHGLGAFSRDPSTGRLTFIESVIDGGTDGQGNAIDGLRAVHAVAVSPDGSTVYGAGRDDNAVAVFHKGGSPNHQVMVDPGQVVTDIDFGNYADLDMGDAPAPYPTLAANDGAWHVATGPRLGTNRDVESDGQPTAAADGDDNDNTGTPDDEDGVTFGTIRVGQLGATATVSVQNVPSGAKLDAWIDFNGDGSWGGPFEQIVDTVAVVNGDNTIEFDVPSWAVDGTTYARFRLSTAGDLGVGGSAADGEVEDYQVTILTPTVATGMFGGQNIVTATADAPSCVITADVDGDGDMDVLSANGWGDTIAWYENNGSQSYTAHTITASADGANEVFAADVDGDGDIDVVSSSANDDRIAWYENDGSQNFTVHDISTTSNSAQSVFAADMDADGDIDILAASYYGNSIEWYENDGAQNFTLRSITTTAQQPYSVVAVDVDGDGDTDVFATTMLDSRIAWYENDGSQNFTQRTISTSVVWPYSVFASDVDGDGDMDALSASYSDDKIAWYENDGSQNFTQRVISTTADGATSVFAADMDGDGDVDALSTAGLGHSVQWYENDGSQGFTEHAIGYAAYANGVFAADVDGDADLDVLAASPQRYTGTVAWFENLGADFGDAPSPYPTTLAEDGARHAVTGPTLGINRDEEGGGTHSTAADGDDTTGTPDDEDGVTFVGLTLYASATSANSADVQIDLQNADASSNRLDAWIDFNRNGIWTDVGEQIFTNYNLGTSNGTQTLSFAIPQDAGSNVEMGATFARFRLSTAGNLLPTGVAADGEVEDYTVTIAATPATVTGTTPSFATSGALVAGTASLDIEFSELVIGGDDAANFELRSLGPDALLGTADDTIIAISANYGAMTTTLGFSDLIESVYRLTVKNTITDSSLNALDGDSDGTPGGDWVREFVVVTAFEGLFESAVTYGSGGVHPTAVTVDDFNADGKDDIAVINHDSREVGILLGDGTGGFAPADTYATDGGANWSVAAGDFNADGKKDLAVTNWNLNSVGILLGNGAGGFASAVSYPSGGSYAHSVTVADFNADEKDDLAVSNYYGNNVGILLGNGAGGFAATVSYASGGEKPYMMSVGDFNADGKSDLAVVNIATENVGILLGNGAGGFASAVTYPSGGTHPYGVAAGDFNADGKSDLAVTNNSSYTVGVLLGNGTGGFASVVTYASGGSAPRSITVDDFNADGNNDLAFANGSGNVGVLLGNGVGGFADAVTFAAGGSYSLFVAQGDFDADGKEDLAVANFSSDNVGVLLNIADQRPEVHDLDSPNAIRFAVQTRGLGAGQLVEAGGNAFDGAGRLEIDGQPFSPNSSAESLTDSDRTVVTPTVAVTGLNVSREITVPDTGNEDFARTVDVFTNPTGSPITTTVRIVGNLGSDDATTVWNTSDGDTDIEITDQWVGTDDADGTGTLAIIHYIHGPDGLVPTAVNISGDRGDNIEWTYDLTVPAGETVRLAYFTILANTRAQAEAAAAVLVDPLGFGGQAAAFLTQSESDSLGNFVFPRDYGDAPLPYQTTLGDDGARHVPVGPTLGTNRDAESNGTHSAAADGDDNTGTPDDEDGVTISVLTASTAGSTTASLTIDLQNADASSNRLDAWIDFNGDGDWSDAGEQVFANYDLGTSNGVQTLNFTVPLDTGSNVNFGETYARFRLSTAGGLPVTGTAADGEVEDYEATINEAPTLTSFADAVAATNEDTQVEITLVALKTRGDEADMDGTVDAFVVQAVSSGTLLIGTNAGSATAYAAGSNDTIDSTKKAHWTPASNVNGADIGAFTVKAKDDDGALSATAVTVPVDVTDVNDVPTLTAFADAVDATNEETEVELTLAELKAQGDEADVDGTVTAFVVQAVSSGTLKIGATAGTATAYGSGSNDTIDSTKNAYWTPASNVNGTDVAAFTVKAKDDDAALSATAVTVTVDVTDVTAPSTTSITLQTPATNPTNAASVNFTVTFSESVTGVGTGDFVIDPSSVSGASVTGVSGSGDTRTVTVSTGTGDGTLSIDFDADTAGGVTDSAGNVSTSDFIGGQTCTMATTQVTLSGGNLTIADIRSTSDDTLTISLSGANVQVKDPSRALFAGSGTTQVDFNTVRVPLASVTGSLTVNAGAGDDTLTVDLSGGDPIPSGGLTYNGEAHTNGDGLIVKGDGSDDTATYTPSTSTQGNGQISINDGTNTRTITFTGLEPIDVHDVATATVNGSSGVDSLTLTEGTDFESGGTDAAIRVSGSVNGGTAIEPVAIWNVGTLEVSTSGGNDTINITSAANAHNISNLTINGGTETDTVNVDGNATVGGAISITSENMVLGSSVTFDTTKGGTVPTGGSVTITSAIEDTASESNSLTINAGTGGNVDLQGAIGGTQSIAGLTITNAADVDLPNVTVEANTNVTQTAGSGTTTVNGDIATTGTGTIGLTTTRNISLVSGSSLTTVNGGITLSANAAGTTAGNFEGIDVVSASISTTGTGDISLTGHGGNTGSDNVGVRLYNGGSVTSAASGATAGTITISGTGEDGTHRNHGVKVDDSGSKVQSVDGNISITGVGGGAGSEYDNYGVFVTWGGAVQSTGTGTNAAAITINGTGGNAASGNVGVYIATSSAKVSSVDGNISITGVGGDGSSSGNRGVMLHGQGIVESTGTTSDAATITINGTGAGGTTSCDGVSNYGGTIRSVAGAISITGTGDGNGSSQGVYVTNYSDYSGVVESTGTGAGAATITINGTGGDSGAGNTGVYIGYSVGIVRSVDGDISITGVGGGTTHDNYGVMIRSGGDVLSTGTGAEAATITINGTGGDGTQENYGVYVYNHGEVTTVDGDINITGTGDGSTKENYGVFVSYNSASVSASGSASLSLTGTPSSIGSDRVGVKVERSGTIGNANGTGPITLTTDTIVLYDSPSIKGKGSLTIAPKTATTAINLGASATDTGLQLNDTELGYLANGFSGITIGHATGGSGTITVDSATFADPVTIASPSGAGAINVVGQITGNDNASVTLDGSGATTTLDANIVTAGNAVTISDSVVLGSSATIDTTNGGAVTAGGNVTITGTIEDTASESNSLTINAGTGGNVDLQGAIGGTQSIAGLTITNAADVDLPNVTVEANTNVTQTAGSGTTTVNGDIATTGTGTIALTSARNISLASGSSLTTVNGGITLSANAAGTAAGNFVGIDVVSASISTTGTGDISLTGHGGHTGDDNIGVLLENTATVSSTAIGTAAGTVNITGTGGDGAGSNDGIKLYGSSTAVSSKDGDIAIDGTAGDGSSYANKGISVWFAEISSTGTGENAADITLTGRGGDATNQNAGIELSGVGAQVNSDSGDINITGYGGNGSEHLNTGVEMTSGGGTITSTGTGYIRVHGIGGGGTSSNDGVYMAGSGAIVSANGGDVEIIGKGGSGSSDGLHMGSQFGSVATSSVSGTLRLDGEVTGAGDGIAMYATIGVAASSGAIELIADTIDLSSTSLIQSSGTLTIKPKTAGTTIGIGGGGGTLNLSDTELGRLKDGFSSITIGDATSGSGAVDVNSSTFKDPVTVVGGSIAVTGLTADDGGTKQSVTLTARTGAITDGGDSATDVVGAVVTLNTASTIGASGDEISLAAASLVTDTSTGNGNQHLSETDSVTVTSMDAGSGSISLDDGTFLLPGPSTTTFIASAVVVQSGATLAGEGKASGAVTVQNGGTLSVGSSSGIIKTGNLTLESGANFNVDIEIDGTIAPGDDYDQTDVTGSVTLNSPTLAVTITGTGPSAGDTFVIINNDSTEGVAGTPGTFNGLAEGATITFGGTIFHITYAGGTNTNDVVITANTAPSFTGGASLAAVDEDTANPSGATVTSLLSSKFSDTADGDTFTGIAVANDASTSGQGKWQYKTSGDTTWRDVGAVTTSAALLLKTDTLLRFLPATDFNGAVGALTVHDVEDSTATTFTSGATRQTFNTTTDASTSHVAAAGVALATSINDVNDDPTLTSFTDAVDTTNEDTEVEITLADLKAQGNEADADGTVDAFVVQAVSSGTLKIGATAGTATAYAAGSNDTIDSTKKAYWTSASNVNGADIGAFTVKAKDDDGALSATAVTVPVDVTDVNDVPILGNNSLTVNEGQTVFLDGDDLSAVDVDDDDWTLTFTVSSVTGGAFQEDSGGGSWSASDGSFTQSQVTGGAVRFVHDGDESAPSYQVKVSDGALETPPASATITYAPVSDQTPVLTATALTISEGATVVLGTANLNATDADLPAEALTFTVSGVSHGQFELAATPGTPITSFTLAQVQAGNVVQFAHDGSETAPAFSVKVSDGTNESTVQAATITFSPTTVVGRHVFYNSSYFDGGEAAANIADDSAIATDKTALLPGGTATLANYTSYNRGINGVMIDIAGLADPNAMAASQFGFRVGNSDDPSTWAVATAPTSVTVRVGAGVDGSDRVTIIWSDGAIAKQWLQVLVEADAVTGLAEPDVFYFGNAIGDSGNSTTNAFVDGTDFAGARDYPRDFLDRAPIDFRWDYNRDSLVDGSELAIARDNNTNFITALKLIDLSVPVPSGAAALGPQEDLLQAEGESDGRLNLLSADSASVYGPWTTEQAFANRIGLDPLRLESRYDNLLRDARTSAMGPLPLEREAPRSDESYWTALGRDQRATELRTDELSLDELESVIEEIGEAVSLGWQ